MSREQQMNVDKLVVGGLHRDDFEWAAQRYEETGYVLVAFLLDRDGYHWKAVYVKADDPPGGRGVSPCLCVSLSVEVCLVNDPVSR